MERTLIKKLEKIRTTYDSSMFGDKKKVLAEKLGKMNRELYDLILKLKKTKN